MEKKKVLFVVHQLNYGGVQKSMISALNAIDYEKYEVTLYIRKNRLELLNQVNNGVSEIIINDDKTHYYRKLYSLFIILLKKIYSIFGVNSKEQAAEKRLSEYIAEQKIKYEKKRYFSDGKKYDVAVSYIQGYTAKLVADCIEADRKIMFFHGSEDERHELHKEIFSRIDFIVGVNEGVKNVLCELYPKYANKITFIENYIDAERVIEKSKEFEIEKEESKTTICSCSRIVTIKGFDMAVEAAKILKEKGHSFKWLIVGDGPERNKLERLISEYGLNDYFNITGMIDNPYPWINNCDIFVLSSYAEAHPLSIIEAQILRKPVVTTSTVGGKCLVRNEENGIVTDFSAEALSQGIEKLLNNDSLREHIADRLAAKDYSKAEMKYREGWKMLLD